MKRQRIASVMALPIMAALGGCSIEARGYRERGYYDGRPYYYERPYYYSRPYYEGRERRDFDHDRDDRGRR